MSKNTPSSQAFTHESPVWESDPHRSATVDFFLFFPVLFDTRFRLSRPAETEATVEDVEMNQCLAERRRGGGGGYTVMSHPSSVSLSHLQVCPCTTSTCEINARLGRRVCVCVCARAQRDRW